MIALSALAALAPALACGCSNLWETYKGAGGRAYLLGRYKEAEDHLQDALIEAESFGPTDLRLAEVLNNLAEVYLAEHKYAEAEPLFKRALDIRVKKLGAVHPAIAMTVCGLADVYLGEGRDSDALYNYRKALIVAVRPAGALTIGGEFRNQNIFVENLLRSPDTIAGSPETARVLDCLANYYRSHQQYSIAAPLYKRVVDMYSIPASQDLSGWFENPWDCHPDLAESLVNLAEVYQASGRTTEAEPLFKRALAYAEKTFGDSDPRTAQVLQRQAAFLHSQNRESEAEEAENRAAEILDRAARG